MSDVRLLYVTAPNIKEARWIGQQLVERRLVACANILPEMESIYHWNGGIQNDRECVVILKTRAENVEAATKAIVELHSYDVPCVVSLVVDEGSEPYLKWVRDEAKPV